MKERSKINMNVINNGPVLSSDQQNLLDLNFTPGEIKEAMWSIPEDKAPGLDGFNSGIYKAAWEIVGTNVVKAVEDSFCKWRLPENLETQQQSLSFQRLPLQTPQVTIVQSLVAILYTSIFQNSSARSYDLYWDPS